MVNDRMTPREGRRLYGSVLLIAVALIGLVLLFTSGCAPTLRKTLSATTAGAELAAKVTRDACRALATSGCKTNPCPALDKCHRAEVLIVQSAKTLTEAAKLINEVTP